MDSTANNSYFDLKGEPITNANKNKIIDAAIQLFSEKGFSSVSIRDITREVNIKESSLYNHFSSKDELLKTIFYNFRMETAKIMPPTEQLDSILAIMSPKQFLEKGFQNFKEHISNPSMEKIWRIMYLEQYRNPLAREIYLQDIVENTLHFLEIVFDKLILLKRIKPDSPAMLAAEYQYPLFSMIEVFMMLRIDQKDTTDIESRMADHIEFFTKKIV
ncbi:helix-turn-helix domain-containing protein [Paenibacillus sediminis]|uniref:AcrR family transcriptional regulator n=1 Tax=Paenibacillus sediminis TaxID=664909 RepID=A0ABS4H3V6_9BACL|nr:helix-turn-helix domain-containing protein [Paenibacillus sediminis]MBP1937193.1 AcrR family transcriptional regulator [Paenibacillus sediminis]